LMEYWMTLSNKVIGTPYKFTNPCRFVDRSCRLSKFPSDLQQPRIQKLQGCTRVSQQSTGFSKENCNRFLRMFSWMNVFGISESLFEECSMDLS
jgi:hypothetical protein